MMEIPGRLSIATLLGSGAGICTAERAGPRLALIMSIHMAFLDPSKGGDALYPTIPLLEKEVSRKSEPIL
jgi:hypothetical protein